MPLSFLEAAQDSIDHDNRNPFLSGYVLQCNGSRWADISEARGLCDRDGGLELRDLL